MPRYTHRLIIYFRSGWAFLIPYLIAYLIYATLGFSVNPGQSRFPLLRVFHVLHVIHLLFLIVVFYASWKRYRSVGGETQPAHSTISALHVMPWITLAVFFFLVGVYLEFPSDPWQHLTRLNEWNWVELVTEHSTWKKSSYFLAYSFLGNSSPPQTQLYLFDLYYAFCCLLLSWQYFRLGLAIGLSERSAFFFVLLQALLLGNNGFGFYRYYGISSTIFAQIGAVAAIRILIEFGNNQLQHNRRTGSAVNFDAHLRPLLFKKLSILLLSLICLSVLIAFNHIQGLGIVCIAACAVLGWLVVVWNRRAIIGLVISGVLLSLATILWYPRHPLIDTVYQPAGWLSPWYGFNLLVPNSPAFESIIAVVGLSGLLSIFAALWLSRRNHVAAWLTLFPLVALCLPCFSLPLANALAAQNEHFAEGYIFVFNRMLFTIPTGLAIVVAFSDFDRRSMSLLPRPLASLSRGLKIRYWTALPFIRLILVLFVLIIAPVKGPVFNRLYHTIMVPPRDLSIRHVISSPMLLELSPPSLGARGDVPLEISLQSRAGLLATAGISYAMNATGLTQIRQARKWMTWPALTPPSLLIPRSRENLRNIPDDRVKFAPFTPVPALFSSGSTMGRLTHHWLPFEVALEHAGQPELFAPLARDQKQLRPPEVWLEWQAPVQGQSIAANGVGVALTKPGVEERGDLRKTILEPSLIAGQTFLLRPVMRTRDGNAWKLRLIVKGPDFSESYELIGRPDPLGGDVWVFADVIFNLNHPGNYQLELLASTLWPKEQYQVRYDLTIE